jgi:multiple sugar transport system substrate-binding protein
MAGAGGAALWLGGCGSSNSAKPVAGDEWKQFGGTTLNFISENTAPTSAIAANLKPFTDLTGIEIKITQLELAALVQKVALDFASGSAATRSSTPTRTRSSRRTTRRWSTSTR